MKAKKKKQIDYFAPGIYFVVTSWDSKTGNGPKYRFKTKNQVDLWKWHCKQLLPKNTDWEFKVELKTLSEKQTARLLTWGPAWEGKEASKKATRKWLVHVKKEMELLND